MAHVPLSYNLRSLFVRKSSTLLTIVSIGATVAVLGGVLALQQGFVKLFQTVGSDRVVVFFRPGSTNEGDSMFVKSRADLAIKTLPELAETEDGRPIASAETFLAVRLRKMDGGETNVPIRGVQPMSFVVHEDRIRITEGSSFKRGTDEVIVGSKLVNRIQGCQLNSTIRLNTTPFIVVGIFESDGPYASEIWGDIDRMGDALELGTYNRVIGRLDPGVDIEELGKRMEKHKEVPAKVSTERDFLAAQTAMMSGILLFLGYFLGVIMGIAAVFTAMNTMQTALATRTREVGILLSTGFRPGSIFLSFLFESLVLGLLGGLIGVIFTLPVNGIETGTTNFQTFTEVAFAFRVTPTLLLQAVLFAVILGLIGGALPAWRASRMEPVDALRRR